MIHHTAPTTTPSHIRTLAQPTLLKSVPVSLSVYNVSLTENDETTYVVCSYDVIPEINVDLFGGVRISDKNEILLGYFHP